MNIITTAHCQYILSTTPISTLSTPSIVTPSPFPGNTPLHIACKRGDYEAVGTLVERGGYIEALTFDKTTPLHRASAAGSLPIVSFLCDLGADIEVWTKPFLSTQPYPSPLSLLPLLNCHDTSDQHNPTNLHVHSYLPLLHRHATYDQHNH